MTWLVKNLLPLFLLFWVAINLLQAGFTEVDPDEAYYWMYSKELAWGYFDHPSAIALFIKTGFYLFPGAVGLRLFSALFQTGTFYLIWLIIGKPKETTNLSFLIILFAAMPMLQVYSFISTPDAPLLFFSALFLYLYQQFLSKSTWVNALLLGACMAALLHSKYHGILLIGFVLLSNLRLLQNVKFWAASIWGFLLFFPHLFWQYQNDFPSFRYHLSGRDDVYEFKYTLTYLFNQVVIFSPLMLPFILLAIKRFKASNLFERSWKLMIIGVWTLFLVLTLKGHAEPQWTAILSIFFVLLLYKEGETNPKSRKWIRIAGISTIVIIGLARIFLLLPLQGLDSDFHKREWIQVLKDKAAGAPVLFMDSYRDPSKYSFYARTEAYTLTDVYYRKNQYDLWDWEQRLHNQKVFIVTQGNLECQACQDLELPNRGSKKYLVADSFQVSQNVWLKSSFKLDTVEIGKTYTVSIEIENPYTHQIETTLGTLPLQLQVVLQNAETEYLEWYPLEYESNTWPPGTTKIEQVKFTIPDWTKTGPKAILYFGIRTGDLFPAINSKGAPILLSNPKQ